MPDDRLHSRFSQRASASLYRITEKIGRRGDDSMIGVVFEPKRGFRLRVMLMFLIFAGLSACAQSGTDATPASPPQSSISSSALNGNWYIAGNRMKKQFPLLSVYLHVDGTQVIGHGWMQAVCPNDPRNGAGGSLSLNGEIAPGGAFTLRNNPRTRLHVEISGQVPAEGETTWSGEYTITGDISPRSTVPFLVCWSLIIFSRLLEPPQRYRRRTLASQ